MSAQEVPPLNFTDAAAEKVEVPALTGAG